MPPHGIEPNREANDNRLPSQTSASGTLTSYGPAVPSRTEPYPQNGKITVEHPMPETIRRKTPTVLIGKVRVGSDAPVVVQSMTNTDTANVSSTVHQVAALHHAGSEIVRG